MKFFWVLANIFFIFLFNPAEGLCGPESLSAKKEMKIVSENESIDIPVNSNKHMYLIVKFTNLSDTPAFTLTSSAYKGKTLKDAEQGPVSFRTLLLEKKGSSVTKTFICKGKDLLSVHVKTGKVLLKIVEVNK